MNESTTKLAWVQILDSDSSLDDLLTQIWLVHSLKVTEHTFASGSIMSWYLIFYRNPLSTERCDSNISISRQRDTSPGITTSHTTEEKFLTTVLCHNGWVSTIPLAENKTPWKLELSKLYPKRKTIAESPQIQNHKTTRISRDHGSGHRRSPCMQESLRETMAESTLYFDYHFASLSWQKRLSGFPDFAITMQCTLQRPSKDYWETYVQSGCRVHSRTWW